MLRLLPAIVLLGAVAPSLRAQSDEAAIVRVVTRLFDGMRSRDTALMRSLFAPEARLVAVDNRGATPTVTFTSPDRWIEGVGRGSGPGPDEKIFDPEVRVDADLAQVWTYYELWVGPRLNHCGYDAFLMARLGGDWKIVQAADTRRSPCTPR